MPSPPGPTANLSFARDLPLTREAVGFARRHHRGQRRPGDGAPFLIHPLEVASLLERAHYPDYVVAAAVLHDVLEDTDVDRGELAGRFGDEVADLVALVSDDALIEDEDARKDEVRERVREAGGFALAIYAADKVSKVRELRLQAAAGAELASLGPKITRHRKSLHMLEDELPGSRLAELLRFELEALEALPPGGPRAARGRARP